MREQARRGTTAVRLNIPNEEGGGLDLGNLRRDITTNVAPLRQDMGGERTTNKTRRKSGIRGSAHVRLREMTKV